MTRSAHRTPSKQQTLTQCWPNVVPPSWMVEQHCPTIGLLSSVCAVRSQPWLIQPTQDYDPMLAQRWQHYASMGPLSCVCSVVCPPAGLSPVAEACEGGSQWQMSIISKTNLFVPSRSVSPGEGIYIDFFYRYVDYYINKVNAHIVPWQFKSWVIEAVNVECNVNSK